MSPDAARTSVRHNTCALSSTLRDPARTCPRSPFWPMEIPLVGRNETMLTRSATQSEEEV